MVKSVLWTLVSPCLVKFKLFLLCSYTVYLELLQCILLYCKGEIGRGKEGGLTEANDERFYYVSFDRYG